MGRRFLGVRGRRSGGGGGGFGGGGGVYGPAAILGPLLHADFDAADPGIVLNGGNVASIPNRGTDSAAMVQATAANQPAYSATSFAGGPGMTFDGTTDHMTCTFASAIPANRRPYIWVVAKAANLTASDQILISLEPSPALQYIVGWSNKPSVATFTASVATASGIGSATLAATETLNTHLVEIGNTPNGTAAFVFDGSAVNGSPGTSFTPATTPYVVLRLASYNGGQLGNYIFRRVIVANDMPSQAQIDAMRAYLRSQSYGLVQQTPPLDPLMIDYWHSELGVTLNGGAVDSWRGQIAGLTLPYAGARPTYSADGTSFNGRPVVQCTADSASLYGQSLSLPIAGGSRPYVVSIFRYRSVPGVGVVRGLLAVGTTAGQDALYLRATNSGTAALQVNTPAISLTAQTPADTLPHRWEVWADGTNLNSRLDGTQVTAASTVAITATPNALGIGQASSGIAHQSSTSHAFHAIFSAKPSDAYLAQLRDWALAYWGV